MQRGPLPTQFTCFHQYKSKRLQQEGCDSSKFVACVSLLALLVHKYKILTQTRLAQEGCDNSKFVACVKKHVELAAQVLHSVYFRY